jgi:hypothetical protein
MLAELARRAPLLPPRTRWRSLISTPCILVYGHAKQGAAFARTKIGGKNVLVREFLTSLGCEVRFPHRRPEERSKVICSPGGCLLIAIGRSVNGRYYLRIP